MNTYYALLSYKSSNLIHPNVIYDIHRSGFNKLAKKITFWKFPNGSTMRNVSEVWETSLNRYLTEVADISENIKPVYQTNCLLKIFQN